MVAEGSGGSCSQNVAQWLSALLLSGFMDPLTVENAPLCSGPRPD